MSHNPANDHPAQSAERAHPGAPADDDVDVAEDIAEEDDDDEGEDDYEDDDDEEADAE